MREFSSKVYKLSTAILLPLIIAKSERIFMKRKKKERELRKNWLDNFTLLYKTWKFDENFKKAFQLKFIIFNGSIFEMLLNFQLLFFSSSYLLMPDFARIFVSLKKKLIIK